MQATPHVAITPQVKAGAGEPLLVIAGPCQIESLEHCLKIGVLLKEICARLQLQFVFKSSFDKANRTSISGKRGPGMEEGLGILSEVRKALNAPVLTDIHLPEHADAAGRVVDILQIPAFLCRQTDLLIAAGKTGKTVNVKKGQFLAPQDMAHAAEKIVSAGSNRVLFCERGSCFGYRDLIVDMRNFEVMRRIGYPVIFDATHSVQQMGGAAGSSGGSREFVAPLARAAVAAGVDGLFLECHDAPDRAPSDGPSMLALDTVEPLLAQVAKIRQSLELTAN